MEIHRYESDLLQSNMYVICENTHAIVIDPCRQLLPMEGLTVDCIILTHEHYDHISGVNIWKNATHAKVLCSAACGANIQSNRRNLARFFEIFCEMQTWVKLENMPEADLGYICQADETFIDEMEFTWQGHSIKLMEMPGHSAGSIGILLDDHDFFSGDSLMENCKIELRFPGGSTSKWKEIGQPKLDAIPKGTRIWPGHFTPFVLK